MSKLKNETYHMFSNLHPGTTYLISVRARTAKGFGQTALTEITTNISGIGTTDSLSVLVRGGVKAAVKNCKIEMETGAVSMSRLLSVPSLLMKHAGKTPDFTHCVLYLGSGFSLF